MQVNRGASRNEQPPTESPDTSLLGAIEAILLTADRPATPSRIAEAIGLARESAAGLAEHVDALNRRYAEAGCAFRIEEVAGGLRVMTLPEHADAVAAFHNLGASNRLSRAAVETLSIIAYRQPITRAQVESIRGVACGEVLRSLLERRLIAIPGRAEEVGRPILYGTSRTFLEEFGLSSLRDLPPVEAHAAAGGTESRAATKNIRTLKPNSSEEFVSEEPDTTEPSPEAKEGGSTPDSA